MSMIGYARVSSTGQSLDIQMDKLKNCHKIFKEKISASSTRRESLEACLEYLREDDTLVVTKIDRLARSTWHLCQITNELERKKVNLQVLDQNINTNDSSGRLLFNMLGSIAQFETEIRSERQIDGINRAKLNGVHFGRTKKLAPKRILELQEKRKQNIKIKDLMKEYGMSKASIYRYLNYKIEL
jgi:DNA invertase Pin-like site-specific DNA recombinase